MDNKKTKVYTKPNGPIIVTGSFIVEHEDGKTEALERLVLCRCGESGKMPYCDATHNRINFQSS